MNKFKSKSEIRKNIPGYPECGGQNHCRGEYIFVVRHFRKVLSRNEEVRIINNSVKDQRSGNENKRIEMKSVKEIEMQ